jgi:uncharacterized GH25 family protein
MRRAALFLVLAAPSVALAHDTWLLPSRAAIAVGEILTLEMTSAMRFPEPESPVRPERIARSGLRLGGTIVPLRPEEGGGKALRLSATPRADGLATVFAESLPRDIDLKPDEVEHYLAEAGATEVLGQWTKGGGGQWHETYVKFTKSFVRVGAARDDRSWAEPVGMALEIVPQDDPARLTSGRRLALRILEDGKPAAGLAVAAATTGGAVAATQVTDAKGQVTFTLAKAGPWLIKAIRIRAAEAPGSWRSRFTTLTLDVGAAH